jgi:hypothetical protein
MPALHGKGFVQRRIGFGLRVVERLAASAPARSPPVTRPLEATTMRIKLSQLCVALAAGSLALAVNAQPSGNTSSGAAPAASSGATATQSSKPAKSATKPHAKQRGSAAHAHRQARRESRAPMASEANAADSAYKAALRRCVTGPQSSRDACLDQAIAQHGPA